MHTTKMDLDKEDAWATFKWVTQKLPKHNVKVVVEYERQGIKK